MALAWDVCLRAPTGEGVAQVMGTREREMVLGKDRPCEAGRTLDNSGSQVVWKMWAGAARVSETTVKRPGHLQVAAHLLYGKSVMARLQLGMATQASAVPSRTCER